MDALRGDEDIGLGPRATVEAGDRPGPPLVDLDQAVPEVEVVGAEPVDERVQQHLLEDAAVDGELRPRIAGGGAPRFLPDLLAPPGAVHEHLRRDRPDAELVEQAEGVELAHGVGQQVDPDPQGAQLAHRLEHVDLDPDLVQAQGGGGPTDAPADDGERGALVGHGQGPS